MSDIPRHDWLKRAARQLALIWLGFVALPPTIGCDDPEAMSIDAVDVRILAKDATWGASCFLPQPEKGATEVPCGREVHVPVGADVRLSLASRDYICIFSAPGLGLRDFAAPGLPTELCFRANREGTFELHGDEMCGLPHAEQSEGRLVVENARAFRAWVQKRTKEGRK